MTIHHCMSFPCPVCSAARLTGWGTGANPDNVVWTRPPKAGSFVSFTSGVIRQEHFTYTWPEAVMFALRCGSKRKPVVRSRFGGWAVIYYTVPVAINAAS